MEELFLSALGEVLDGLLRDAILEVGIDPAKGELLALAFAGFAEHTVRELTVVAVVMLHLHPVLSGKLFKCKLCIDGLGRGKVACHKVNKLETQIVVDKYCCVLVACLGKHALCLGVKPRLSQLHVVDGDALPRLGCGKDGMTIVASCFGVPTNFGQSPKKAAGAAWRLDVGKFGGDLAIVGELAKAGEQGVAKAVVPTHQLGLVVRSRD
jgi:hypothetical protein